MHSALRPGQDVQDANGILQGLFGCASLKDWKLLSEVTAGRQAIMPLLFLQETSRQQPTDSIAPARGPGGSAPGSRSEAMIMSAGLRRWWEVEVLQ